MDLSDLIVTGFGGVSVYVKNGFNGTLSNVYCTPAASATSATGFQINGGEQMMLTNCYANGAYATGYAIGYATDVSLYSCASVGNVQGYYVVGCQNSGLYTCGCDSATGNWFTISGGRATSWPTAGASTAPRPPR
jgi:hypothetical protein